MSDHDDALSAHPVGDQVPRCRCCGETVQSVGATDSPSSDTGSEVEAVAVLTPAVEGLIYSTVRRMTYRPGWSLVYRNINGVPYIEAYTNPEVDSRGGDEIEGGFSRRIPIVWPAYSANSVEGVAACVRHAVHEWAAHEADEWLRLDGELVHDPHVCPQCRIGGCRA